MNKLGFRFGQRRPARFVTSTVLGGIAIALMAGCGGGGGGGGGGNTGALSGDNLQFAGVTADLKATVAGSAGPYTILQVVQNNGNPPGNRGTASGPQFIAFLGLYMDVVASTGKITLNYSTTNHGGTDAGQVVITIGANQTYHATGHIGGSLAMTLDVTVVLTGTHGANTLNGHVSLDGQHITFDLKNLSADDNGNIGADGEMDVDAMGLSHTAFTNLSGKATTDINGNVSVSAGGQTFTGTGKLNLLQGTVQLNLTTPSGADPLTAFLVSQLNSTIQLTDGKTINVTDLLHFDLGKLSGSTGGLPGGGTTGTFAAPIAIDTPAEASTTYVWQAASNGQMVGQATLSTGTTEALYWDSPASGVAKLPVPVDTVSSAAYGIANTGTKRIVVGFYAMGDGYQHACTWTSNSTSGTTNFGAPQVLPTDSSLYPQGGVARAISANGAHIVGSAARNGVDVPVVFTADRVFELPHANLGSDPYEATGVANNGNVLGVRVLQYDPEVWLNVSISGSSITANQQPLLNTNGSNMPGIEAFHMGPDGTVAGAELDGKPLFWSAANGYDAKVLPTPGNRTAVVYGVSDDGKKFTGIINPDGGGINLAYWPSVTTPATNVSEALPTSDFTQIGGDFILSDGSLIAIAQRTGQQNVTFVYIKKK